MSRYIDAEIAIEKCNKLIDNADSCPNPFIIEGVRVVRNVILSECETGVPTANVVEVVRCRDCKYRYVPIRCALWYATVDEREYFAERGEDFYCSYGERRSEE